MYDVIYREAHHRIVGLVKDLQDDELGRKVIACPEWTVRDLIAHLAGMATDYAADQMPELAHDRWTAGQVAERRGRSLAEDLAEWAEHAPAVETKVALRGADKRPVHDITQHEADLRATLGLDRLPEDAWRPMLAHLGKSLPYLTQLPVTVQVNEWLTGDGDPVLTVQADPYELWRALFGRRSIAQLAAWNWSADPAPYVGDFTGFTIFPPRADPLVEP